MGKRVIKANLSFDSLNQMAKDFKTYVNTLDLKCERFTERLINEVGIPVINVNMSSFQGDSEHTYQTFVEIRRQPNKVVSSRLVVQNEDILFIEFGAGIHYNNGNAHPQASDFGYGVGKYPGQTHAITPGYWWWRDDSGTLRFSLGTEATMPVFKAYTEMVDQVGRIAREVFGNG